MEIDAHISAMAPAARREDALLKVVGELVQELHPQRAKPVDVSRSSRLERDLGIDSLARTKCRDRTFCAACDGITRMPLAFADEALNELLDLAKSIPHADRGQFVADVVALLCTNSEISPQSSLSILRGRSMRCPL
jgi:hypothetical protein